jgi:hypothetical protein
MYYASNNFKTAMLSPSYRLYIKIQLFDNKMKFIKEITKQVTSDLGTLAINNDSPIRRSFKLTLDNSLGDFIFGENNLIWLDKRLKLFIGLSTWQNTLEWVPAGVFILTDPEDNHSPDGKTATINAVDKAYLMTEKYGKFVNELKIETGSKVVDTIKTIAKQFGETLFNFDNDTTTTPYELTYQGNDNAWNALQDLANFSKAKIFYDVNGYLRFKKIDLNEFDAAPITWSYKYGDKNEKLYAGNVRQMDSSNLYNDIYVVGGGSDKAVAKYRLTVDETNSVWKNSPYSIQKIGRRTLMHNDGNYDPVLLTDDDCKFRAKKLLMDSLGFRESVQMTLAPNFLHDADDVVWIEDKTNGITGNKYIIQSINLPLSPSAMTMDVLRINKIIDDWNFI